MEATTATATNRTPPPRRPLSPRRVFQAAEAAAAAAAAVAPKLSPTTRAIQTIRSLFKLLNDEEFLSEVLLERKRRRDDAEERKKQKQKPPPLLLAKVHNNKNNNGNRKRSATAAAPPPPVDDDDDNDEAALIAGRTGSDDDSSIDSTANDVGSSPKRKKKNAVSTIEAAAAATATTTTATTVSTLPASSSHSPPPLPPLLPPFEQKRPALEFPMLHLATATARATEIGRTEEETAAVTATTAAVAATTAAASTVVTATAATTTITTAEQQRDLESLAKRRPKPGTRQSWDDTYQSLVAFQQLYGHVVVPSQDALFQYLAKWCKNQRNHWKWFLQKEGSKKSDLHQDRINRLIAVGMGTRQDGPTDLHTIQWEAKFQQVLQFYKTHGHCNVPRSNPNAEFYDLGMWLERQRKAFKNRQHNNISKIKTSSATSTGKAKAKGQRRHSDGGYMTDEQMRKLASIPGFRFTNKQVDFQTRLSQLTHYKNVYGHARVPQSYSSSDGDNLGIWVSNMRKRYQAGLLTPDRLATLEAMGMEWRVAVVAAAVAKEKDHERT
jgi:Helicase associated domain